MSVLDRRICDASARGYLSSSVNVEEAAELRSVAIDEMHSAMTIFRVRDLGAAVEWRALGVLAGHASSWGRIAPEI
jgi:hypothetical protein